MKPYLIAALVALAAAFQANAQDSAPGTSAEPARCRLVTGALKANFGGLEPVSVVSDPQTAAMDYRCGAQVGAAQVAGKNFPVALYWSVAASTGNLEPGTQQFTPTYGSGGILGIAPAAAARAPGGLVSVVVAP